MKKFSFLILWLAPFFVNGQIRFQKIFTVNSVCFGNTICNVPGSRYAIAGKVNNYPHKVSMYAMLLDEYGDTLWTKMLQDTVDVFANNIIFTTDSNLVVTGYRANGEIVFLKLDLSGNILVSKAIMAPANFYVGSNQIINAVDSGFIMLGKVYNNQGYGSTILIKLDKQGNVDWTKALYNNISGLQIVKSDSFYLITASSPQTVLIKINSQGNILWGRTFNYAMESVSTSIKKTNDNGFILGGFIDHYPTMDWIQAILLKVDSNGNIQWSTGYGMPGASDTKSFDVFPKTNGDYVFCINNPAQFFYGAGLVETDSAGSPVSYHIYETGGDPIQTVLTDDNGFLLCTTGVRSAQGFNILSPILVKTDSAGSSGCYDTTAAIVYNSLIPIQDTVLLSDSAVTLSSDSLILFQDSSFSIHNFCFSVNEDSPQMTVLTLLIYPNPTQRNLVIRNLPSEINSLAIYNLPGQKIWTRNFYENKNEISVDVSELPPGIYIVQITSGEKTWRGKVVKE